MRATPRLSPLIGRQRELATLETAYEQAAAGRASVMLCVGEAGIGKTRLTAEFEGRVAARGATVLRGGAVDADDGLPFGVVVDALRNGIERRVLSVRALPPAVRRELATLLPGLAPPSDRDAVPAAADGFARVRLFEAILELLVDATKRSPLVVVLEDLHWADRSTLDIVSFLVHNLADRRALLVATFRPEAGARTATLRAWLAELTRRPNVHRLELLPLDRRESATLIAALLHVRPSARLVDAIVARSDGIPFAIEELTAQAGDAGDPGAVPPALRDSILSSLATLDREAQRVAGAAAILGDPIDEELITAVLEVAGRDLAAPLRQLVDRRILALAADGSGYEFRHELTREVVQTDLLPTERRGLHAAAASALEARRRDDDLDPSDDAAFAARIARHRSAGGRPGEAFTALVDAGNAARTVVAFAEAAGFLRRALDLWDAIPPSLARTVDRADIAARAAEAAAQAGDPVLAEELAAAALGWLGHGDRVRRGLLWERVADCRFYSGAPGRLEAAREAVRLLPNEAPHGSRVRAHVAVVEQLAANGNFSAARREARRTVRIAVDGGWRAHETLAVANRSLLAGAGTLEDAVQACRDGVRLGLADGYPDVVGISYVNLIFSLTSLSRFNEAAAVMEEGLEVGRRLGLGALIQLQVAANGADALVFLGRWEAADRVVRSVAGEPSPIVEWLSRLPLVNTAILRGDAGLDLAGLEQVFELGTGMAGQLGIWSHMLAAELALELGEVAAVRTHVQAVMAAGGPISWRAMSEAQALRAGLAAEGRAVAAARMRGDDAAYREAMSQAAGLAKTVARLRAELPGDYRLARLFIAMAEAEASRGDGPGDVAAWRAAGDGWDAVGARYWAACCRLGEAEALLAVAGDPARVAGLLSGALAAAVELGARTLQASVEALASRARVALGSGDAEVKATAVTAAPPEPMSQHRDVRSLSVREREVLLLLAEGLTNREIGGRLFISPKTAGVHVSNILAKLGARRRIEAAAIARRSGLL